MYAKTLVPTDPPTPALIATTSHPKTLFPELACRGWTDPTTSTRPNAATATRLVISRRRLELVVDDVAILTDDSDSGAPPGWWPAVDRAGGRTVVIIGADFDLRSTDLGAHLHTLMATPGALMWALVPITHPPEV